MTAAPAAGGGTGLDELGPLVGAVIGSALDCVVVIDEGGLVVAFNPAAEATFGYARAEALGRPIGELIVPPAMRERHAAGMARYLATGEAAVLGRRVELEAATADGRLIPVELAITEVELAGRRLFTAYLRDLTDQRRQAAEIERQRDALHQKDKLAALGSLLAGVAHELNNPLSVVIGQSLMLRESLAEPGGGDVTARAEKIQLAAERCGRIVKTFLAMARQRKAERRPVEVAPLIEGALGLLGYGLRSAGVEAATDIALDLPTVAADPDQLHQVLVNLALNAQQAVETREGERRLAVAARFDPADATIVIRFEDNGPGVPEAIAGRIFEPFFTTKPQGLGTGIGLAVSRGLVEAHGGTLTLAASERLGGAAFEVRLPAVPLPAEPSPQEAPPAAAAPGLPRVLVVDDEPAILDLIADILEARGYRVATALGGRAAQALIEAEAEDVAAIFCDIRMADGDGPSLYRFVQAMQPRLAGRMIFLTGDTLGPAASRFLEQSKAPVVEKPFLPSDLVTALTAVLTE